MGEDQINSGDVICWKNNAYLFLYGGFVTVTEYGCALSD